MELAGCERGEDGVRRHRDAMRRCHVVGATEAELAAGPEAPGPRYAILIEYDGVAIAADDLGEGGL